MGQEMRIFLKNDLGYEGNAEILFKYLEFRSVVSILHEGELVECAIIEKPDRFYAAIARLGNFTYIPTALGVEPNIEIDFELDDAHWKVAKGEIIQGLFALLKDTSWNIALIRGDASPLFARRYGKLFLNSRYVGDSDLSPDRIAGISLPYTLEEMSEL